MRHETPCVTHAIFAQSHLRLPSRPAASGSLWHRSPSTIHRLRSAAPVTSPHTGAEVARAVIGSEIAECLLVIFLNARHRVTGYSEIARGTLNASRFTPRDVFVPALHANAAAVIVAHNHPTGEVTPSRADRTATASLREAARLIGLPLADHLIVTTDSVFSFRERDGWSD